MRSGSNHICQSSGPADNWRRLKLCIAMLPVLVISSLGDAATVVTNVNLLAGSSSFAPDAKLKRHAVAPVSGGVLYQVAKDQANLVRLAFHSGERRGTDGPITWAEAEPSEHVAQ